MNTYLFIERVPIHFLPGKKWACIHELSGKEEQGVRGTGVLDTLRLVDKLLFDASDTAVSSGQAGKLTVAERDRILAAVFINTYGPKISTTTTCQTCGMPFDLDFLLEDMINNYPLFTGGGRIENDSEYIFEWQDKFKFRLPTGEDEVAILEMEAEEAEEELFRRCIKDGKAKEHREELLQAMQEVAPTLNINLDSTCPECGTKQSLQFDMQHYLLTAIIQEKRQLVFDVHRMAKAYGWTLDEILGLPRSIRKTYVSLLESEQ